MMADKIDVSYPQPLETGDLLMPMLRLVRPSIMLCSNDQKSSRHQNSQIWLLLPMFRITSSFTCCFIGGMIITKWGTKNNENYPRIAFDFFTEIFHLRKKHIDSELSAQRNT